MENLPISKHSMIEFEINKHILLSFIESIYKKFSDYKWYINIVFANIYAFKKFRKRAVYNNIL